MAVQEGVPIEDNPHLRRLFGSEILSRLPTSGSTRIRRTAVLLIGEEYPIREVAYLTLLGIGAYATWFTTQYTPPPGTGPTSLLMNAISYVVSALPEAALCLPAANSLRDICDANRAALAPHISAFGELHAGLANIPVSGVFLRAFWCAVLIWISRIQRRAKYYSQSRVSFRRCHRRRKFLLLRYATAYSLFLCAY